ncbi:uncharacterized protein ttc6 [Rhincodon typus]|uniref:uncharacterized protein ttc6 n=1 Tax=Rhincodon typus TaxID=259920 RepID=UPI00202F316D|nr:uncharacterized protein ttc6 [Rhincodon typus]
MSEDMQHDNFLTINDDNSLVPTEVTKTDSLRQNKKIDKRLATSNKKLMGDKEWHEPDGRKRDVFKSAIAPIAGTAAALSMSKRPNPPPKPNLSKLFATVKSSTQKTPPSVPEKEVSVLSVKLHDHKLKTSSKSNVRRSTLATDVPKQNNKNENFNKSPSLTEQISSDSTGVQIDKEDNAHSIHSQGVRSASELLEEAKYLVMPDTPKIYERNFQQSKPEQSVTAAQQTFTAKAKSVDEIIASLRSGRHTTSQSAADQKIKGLLERVFGYSHSSKSEDVTEITAEQKQESEMALLQTEGKISLTDSQQRAGKQIKKTEMLKGINQKLQEERKTTKALGSTVISPTTPSETEQRPKSEAALTSAQVTRSRQTSFEVPYRFQDTLTNEDIEKILALPRKVSVSDIIHIKGTSFGLTKGISADRQTLLENEESDQQTSAPATRIPINKHQGHQTIHHFCIAEPSHILPIDLQLASKLYYTPSRIGHGCSKLPESIQLEESRIYKDEDFSSPKQQKIAKIIHEGIPASEVSQEKVQDGVRILPPLSPEFLMEWQRIAEYYVERPRTMLLGESMEIYKDATKLFWTPAFPKFAVPISYMQETLYPKLKVELDHTAICDFDEEIYQLDEEYDADNDEENFEEKAAMQRTLFKKHSSLPDLRVFSFYSFSESFKNINFQAPAASNKPALETFSSISEEKATESLENAMARPSLACSSSSETDTFGGYSFWIRTQEHFLSMIPKPAIEHSEEKRRIVIYINLKNTIDKPTIAKHKSLPNLHFFEDGSNLTISAPFKTMMKEVELQREQLIQVSMEATIEEEQAKRKSIEGVPTTELSELNSMPAKRVSIEKTQPSIAAPVTEAVVKKKQKTKHRKKVKADMRMSPMSRKLAFVYRKLSMPPKAIKRSESSPTLILRDSEKVPKVLQRDSSVPCLFNFENYTKKKGGIPEGVVTREWVRDIWNKWFDEVFPPLEPPIQIVISKKDSPLVLKEKESSHLHANLQEIELQNLQLSTAQEKTELYPTDSNSEVTRAALQSAVNDLTYRIDVKGESTAFNYCRRGALYRRLGQLKSAMEDLNEAIKLEPMLLDIYWQRHFLYLLQLRTSDALDDLNFVLKHNRNHADAYTSKGDIYREKGDITLAIINYSQGLKCRPDDDIYFKRAEMYEKNNDLLLAMEDYFMAFSLNPKRTDAMMKRGLYYFENSTWHLAIQDLTALIKQEPGNAKARNYRGQAYAKQGMHKEAIEDLSVAIHLDPNNWVVFYHRGCLLRKMQPQQALQDFSVSVLINDDVENLSSFLHRGILYTDCSEWHAAIYDFESVLKLDRSICLAHINLGLIYLLKLDYYYEALRKFTHALKVEPTSTRAYVCRAKAYQKIHNVAKALKDITCAIHLQPQTHYFYLLRGQYLYQMKNFELASFCIQYYAEINQASDSSPIQQATVQIFLKNYDKAIENLNAMEKTAPLLTSVGKSQMKAGKYEDALNSFQKALALEPEASEIRIANTVNTSVEIYYHMGLCYTELNQLREAMDSFNNAMKLVPNFAKAYYQRGLCSLKLHDFNCIYDFHRALTINPQFFEVYLSRAVYYAMQGRYLKAILSCNEALKIEPRSIRAFLCRGALKFCSKAYRLAIADLTEAINMNETCILGYFNRAVCHQQMNDLQKALKDYGIVLLLGTHKKLNLKVFVNRGLLYLKMDDHQNALKDFKAAIVEEPENAYIHHAVAICCHKLHYLEEAVNSFSQALKLDPFFVDAYNGRGNVYMDFGDTAGIKQAQKDFVQALHLNPKCVKSRLNLGYNFQVLGRFQKAWNQFSITIDIDPMFHDAYEGRAMVNLQMLNTFAAFQDINAALKICKSAKLFTNRGVISQFTGDLPNAMRDYQKAISLDPTYSLAYFNAANLYFYNRQFSQAHDYYTKAIDLQPGDESALLNRAICRVLLRRAKEALEDFEEAVKLSPYSAHIYFNRANLYATLKQYKDAEKDYSQALHLMPDDALYYKLRADVRGHLGLIEEAIADYKTAIDIQEAG